MAFIINTERLILREWKKEDLASFVEMNGDTNVMSYFPSVLTAKESLELMERMELHQSERGHCYWAVDEMKTGNFIGFIGLKWQDFESPFTPCVDIGWRLKKESWGKGYATEGALASLKYGFEKLGLKKIYSFCPEVNKPSEGIMKKIGMHKVGEFLHPVLDDDSSLKRCVAYSIEK